MATSKTGSAEKNTPKPSRIYRSETNKIIGGVCGGLGEYFNVDPTIVRIIFVIITLFGGSGILIYLILWLVIPSQSAVGNFSDEHIRANASEIKERAQKFAHDLKLSKKEPGSTNSKNWWAIIIVIFGAVFLLNNYGYYDFSQLSRLWPVILIIFGLSILFRK